jgi:hypothetical protein
VGLSAVSLLTWTVFAQAPAATLASDQRPSGTARIGGRITAADTREPLSGATVRLNDGYGGRTTSDADGRYEFRDLPAARYTVDAYSENFISLSYGQSAPGKPRKSLVLADRAATDDVDIALPRAGVILGRVLDDIGNPVSGATVSTMRQEFTTGRPPIAFGGNRATTDGKGEFRLIGVFPGEYVIAALAPPTTPRPRQVDASDKPSGLAITYFPSATDPAAATRVTIDAGQVVAGIDVALLAVPLASISGTVVDSDGRPVVVTGVQARLRDDSTICVGGSAIPRSDGTFVVPNLLPGEYLVRALRRGSPLPGRPAPATEFATAVVVAGENVTDVRVAPANPLTISGRIVFDDPASARSVKASDIQLVALPVGLDDRPLMIPIARVNGDFTFELDTSPGRRVVQATSAAGWMLKRVSVRGVDVTDGGIDLATNAGIDDVEVEFTNHHQDVSGAVTDKQGRPADDFHVLVFARDRARLIAPLNHYSAFANPGDDGRYDITTLAPGDYFAVALDQTPADWQDRDVLDALSRNALRFSLGDRETRRLDLKLSPLPASVPTRPWTPAFAGSYLCGLPAPPPPLPAPQPPPLPGR